MQLSLRAAYSEAVRLFDFNTAVFVAERWFSMYPGDDAAFALASVYKLSGQPQRAFNLLRDSHSPRLR